MNEGLFRTFLIAASVYALEFARKYVKNKLPFEFTYDVELNQSYDLNAKPGEFLLFPEDDSVMHPDLDADAVVSLLYRNGCVPVWIDINVKAVERGKTVFRLLCAGRYSDKIKEYYYWDQGTGPFGIKSPYFPCLWTEKKGKFWLPGTRHIYLFEW